MNNIISIMDNLQLIFNDDTKNEIDRILDKLTKIDGLLNSNLSMEEVFN